MVTIGEARAAILDAARPLGTERLPLQLAAGRILREDAEAREDLPPFAAAAMDGFALASGPERELIIAGEARAGAPFAGTVEPGQAVRISTGAAVPAGASAVVQVERTAETAGGVRVEASEAGDNIRAAGEDVKAGDTVIAAGARIGPAEVALLASLGMAEPEVSRGPRVAVLVTGDELVEAGDALAPGQIRNSNGPALTAQAVAAGGAVHSSSRVGDSPDHTRHAIRRALESDVVVISGGVSVGPHDHVKPALAELGVEERFWRVSLMPGKPTWFGTSAGTLVFGLPGNPVSAMVTFELFARPALLALQGAAEVLPPRLTALLAEPLPRKRREQAVRVRLDGSGTDLRAVSTGRQNSHLLTSMLGAEALAFIPAGEGKLDAGAPVKIERLG